MAVGGAGTVADFPIMVVVGGANAAVGLLARRLVGRSLRRLVGWAR